MENLGSDLLRLIINKINKEYEFILVKVWGNDYPLYIHITKQLNFRKIMRSHVDSSINLRHGIVFDNIVVDEYQLKILKQRIKTFDMISNLTIKNNHKYNEIWIGDLKLPKRLKSFTIIGNCDIYEKDYYLPKSLQNLNLKKYEK